MALASHYLTEDILREVADHAYFNENLKPDRECLERCSRVSRLWRTQFQGRLFKNVSLQSRAHLRSFLYAISATTYGPSLATTVRLLSLSIYPSGTARTFTTQSDIAHILHSLPLLYELRLTLNGLGALDSHTLDSLQASSQIVALRIHDALPQKSVAAYQLLNIWPSVQYLAIKASGVLANDWYISQGSPINSALTLRELRWEAWDVPGERFLKWLLHSSIETLEILHLSRLPDDGEFEQLLKIYGPRLRSLRIPRSDDAILQYCTQLEELCLFYQPMRSPARLKALPRLQHLAVLTLQDEHDDIFHIPSFTTVLPSLRTITCYNWGHPPWSEFAALEAILSTKGIDLVRYDGAGQIFLAMQSEDLVPTTRFPRGVSLGGMHAMNCHVLERPTRTLLPSPISGVPETVSPIWKRLLRRIFHMNFFITANYWYRMWLNEMGYVFGLQAA